jgi:hydroxymethylpyrimidine/phosphomethylpyrimidine kinase
MNSNRPFCLSIGGFDPTAGAGVMADIKTLEHFEVYGMAILACNTLQTDDEFFSVQWKDNDLLKVELEALMVKYDFKALKIGLIQNFDTLRLVIQTARKINPHLMIIWDPILKSSSGFKFHNGAGLELDFLEQHCSLITPNWDEFCQLWGDSIEILHRRNPSSAILIKGGHRTCKIGSDELFVDGKFIEIAGESFDGKSKHGTGCVLSAAITAHLAVGKSMIESCTAAKTYVENFIMSNDTNLGYHPK